MMKLLDREKRKNKFQIFPEFLDILYLADDSRLWLWIVCTFPVDEAIRRHDFINSRIIYRRVESQERILSR